MKELLEKFSYNLTRIKKLPDAREVIKNQNKRLEKEQEDLKEKLLLIQESRLAYQKTIDLFYEESIGQLEKMLNLALQQIFFDRNYSIRITLSGEDKKDKSFSFEIVNNDINQVEDLRDGTGAGVRAVVSFVILSYYLIKFNSPYIFADELYSAISRDYVDGFFEFVHRLCEEQNLTFVLITHDVRFTNYADQIIHVSEGRITVHQEIDTNLISRISREIEEKENEKTNKE